MGSFMLRNTPSKIWDDFKAAAREKNMYPNELLNELIAREVAKWRLEENKRIIQRADELRQMKLL